MKFLVDAQMPRRLAAWFQAEGHDAIHTSQLPDANRTSDREICRIADEQGRVVVTKDDDFVYSHLAADSPRQLLLVGTGNIDNKQLLYLFESKLSRIDGAFESSQFVELTAERVVLHR